MPRVWFRTDRAQAGFSPVEVLLAATVFGFLVVAIMGAIVYGRASTATSGDRARATQLAEEGTEAVRNMRDASFANLVDGTYGLAQSGNIWTLSGSSDTSGIYTRQLTIATVDSTRKTVTATVSWPQGTTTSQVSVTQRFTNWQAALASKTWLGTVLAGGLDASGTNDGLKVATVGNYAYLIRNGGAPSFVIANISNPASPTIVGSLSLPGSPTSIFVSGNYAYITSSSNTAELEIVNISNPASPSVTSTLDITGTGDGKGVFVSGNYAYVARAANGGVAEFAIVNIATPASPSVVGTYGNNINMNDVVVSGNYAYVGTNSSTQEILVINVSIVALPLLSTSVNMTTTGTVNALDLFGSTLLVGQASNLSIYNIATPTSPTRSGLVATTGTATINGIDVDNTNTYAFLGTNNTTAELQIVNIATPASASVVKTVDVSGTASTLSGVAYNSSLDVLAGASASDTQELVIFTKN